MRLLGAGMILFGFLGWKTYAFAGTGFAFIIAASLIVIGILILYFQR